MIRKVFLGSLSVLLAASLMIGNPIYGKASEANTCVENEVENHEDGDENNEGEVNSVSIIDEDRENELSNVDAIEDDSIEYNGDDSEEKSIDESNDAFGNEYELLTCEDVAEEFVEMINKGEQSKISSLYQTEKSKEMDAFFADEENLNNHIGVYNIISSDLLEFTEVDYSDVLNMLYEDYEECIEKPDVYVIGMDLKVIEDAKYFYKGMNYFLISFVREDDAPKIYEMVSISEPQELINKGYCFSDNYSVAIRVMDARKSGKFINGYGRTFDSINGNRSFLDAVKNKRTVPTDSTKVRYRNSNKKTVSINFHDYCLGVLAGELRATKFDGAVRKAQAIAIKTFTWHYIIVPQNPTAGYDLTYASQSYVPGKISENKKVTEDYNAVKDVWMESNGGAIFAAYYKKGEYADQSSLKNGGDFKQEGARWLKDNKIATTYKALLKYYYDNSSASTGGAIRFFDSKKNEL